MPNELETMIDNAIIRGLEQGLEQGRLEARRDDVRDVLRARFTTIPGDLEQRIAAADNATLTALLRLASTAQSIDDA